MVQRAGKGCFMAKIDIKHAFRLCPVRPQDFPLLGYCWQGCYFIDTRLPFGSRSSPYIFNTICGRVTMDHYNVLWYQHHCSLLRRFFSWSITAAAVLRYIRPQDTATFFHISEFPLQRTN